MHMGLCLRQELRQTVRICQRQELRLELRMRAPSDWSFKEPDAMKHVEDIGGKKVIRVTESEMSSYVNAVRNVRKIIDEAVPEIVLISMRGALPIFRATMQSMKPQFLDCEYKNDWLGDEKRITRTILTRVPPDHLVCSIAKTEEERERVRWEYGDKKNITFRAIKANTSYFLADLEGSVEETLRSAFKQGKRRIITALFIDTSVSGTKLGWFMPQFRDALKQVGEGIQRPIHMINVILHHDKDGVGMCMRPQSRSEFLVTSRIDLGVESLITEDSVTLLGSGVREEDIASDAVDVVRAHMEPEQASIMVGDRLFDINMERTGSTAMLFCRIAGDMARQ